MIWNPKPLVSHVDSIKKKVSHVENFPYFILSKFEPCEIVVVPNAAWMTGSCMYRWNGIDRH